MGIAVVLVCFVIRGVVFGLCFFGWLDCGFVLAVGYWFGFAGLGLEVFVLGLDVLVLWL